MLVPLRFDSTKYPFWSIDLIFVHRFEPIFKNSGNDISFISFVPVLLAIYSYSKPGSVDWIRNPKKSNKLFLKLNILLWVTGCRICYSFLVQRGSVKPNRQLDRLSVDIDFHK